MTQPSNRYCSHSLGKYSTGEQPRRTKMLAWTSRPVDFGRRGPKKQQDHTRTGICSAVAESSETGLEHTAGGVVSLTIRTKSSERCDVDHVGMSGNLCKTTTPGANESDFCRQVWSQCKQMNILAVKVAWASAGASRNRPLMPMHERLVNIIPTHNPQRKAGMQRLPGDRSWTVSRSAKRGL